MSCIYSLICPFFNKLAVDFDYGIFSIHKLFPTDSGGLVISRNGNDTLPRNNGFNLFDFDIYAILQKRIENYHYVLSRLKQYNDRYDITVLRDGLKGNIPHSFPILLRDVSTRDAAYFALNNEGFGVVSLYHTLIDEIDNSFSVERNISQRILNLPIHQDAKESDLDVMIKRLIEIIR